MSAKIGLEYRRNNGTGSQLSGPVLPRLLEDEEELFKLNSALEWEITPSTTMNLRFTGVLGRIGETSGDPVSNGPTDTASFAIATDAQKEFDNGIRLRLGYYFEDFTLEVDDYPFAALHTTSPDIELHRYTNAVHAHARVPVVSFWDVTSSAGWKGDELYFDRNEPKGDQQEILHANFGTELRPIESAILNAGLQVEHDLFSGTDLSPVSGAVWRFLEEQSLRLSYRVGRRKPTLTETSIAFVVPNMVAPPPPATFPLVTGNVNLDRETLDAYEAGYRGVFQELGLVVDLQLFWHELDDKIVFVPDATSPVPQALTFANAGEERARGVELSSEWQVFGPVSLFGNYTYADVEDPTTDLVVRDRPRHKANAGVRLRFREGLLEGVSAMANVRYVSRIQQVDGTGTVQTIAEHFRLDVRVAKSFFEERVEFAIIGRNLLDPATLEARPALGSNSFGGFGAERAILFNLRVSS